MIGLEASGIRAFRDSLKQNQHLVRGVVWHAGQGRPLGTVGDRQRKPEYHQRQHTRQQQKLGG